MSFSVIIYDFFVCRLFRSIPKPSFTTAWSISHYAQIVFLEHFQKGFQIRKDFAISLFFPRYWDNIGFNIFF